VPVQHRSAHHKSLPAELLPGKATAMDVIEPKRWRCTHAKFGGSTDVTLSFLIVTSSSM
jgi:hypothetical protein